MVGGSNLDSKLKYDVECYEADISMDMILSYPWMAQNKIGVFPHHKALVVDEPRLLLLYGHQGKGRSNFENNRRGISQISMSHGNAGPIPPLYLPMVGLQVLDKPIVDEECRHCNA